MSSSQYPTLADLDLHGKRVLMRAGFDVPIENRTVVDTSRIESMLPTMRHILDAGASLILMAHQGRPKAERLPEMSQKPLVPVLEKLLGTRVQFAESCVSAETEAIAAALAPGDVLLLENLRYEPGEKKDKEQIPAFGKKLAALADVYVNDAFTNCHRSHASMVEVPKHLPSCIGLHLQGELEHLTPVLEHPRKPVVLIISGLKLETKVPIIEHYISIGKDILLGGAIANTFVAAQGFDIGSSKFEEEWLEKARELMLIAENEENATIHILSDAVLASELSDTAQTVDLPLEDIEGTMAIYDIGTKTTADYLQVIANAETILWNGPLGVHEYEQFTRGSRAIATAVREATARGATSIIGGGDTIDFHTRNNLPLDGYSHVSTGGGAMLEFLAGKQLPALEALKKA